MREKNLNQSSQKNIIVYPLHGSLYLNITNRCTNACNFCIRKTNYGVGYDLWLEREPSIEEVMAALGDPASYQEIVFCGYGEPLLRPEVVIGVSQYLKQFGARIRLNTNGLADLFLGYDILPQLQGLIDTISISLNAHEGKTYQAVTQTPYGESAFNAVIDFIRRSKQFIPNVIASAVRYPGIDIIKAAQVAQDLGVEFRVREFQQ